MKSRDDRGRRPDDRRKGAAAAQPARKPAPFGRPTGKPAGKRTERPAAARPFGKPTKQPFGRPERKPFAGEGGRSASKSFGKPAGKSFGKPATTSFGGKSGRPFDKKSRGPHGKKAPFDNDAPNPFKKNDRGELKPKTPIVRPMTIEPKFPAPAPPRIGDWLLTTRPESEQDLLDELVRPPFGKDSTMPRLAGPALVAMPSLPVRDRPELTFARQGFPIAAIVPVDDPRAAHRLAEALANTLPIAQGRAARARGRQPFALHGWVPDDDRTNPQSAIAEALVGTVGDALVSVDRHWAELRVEDSRAAWTENGLLAQMCVAEGQIYLGVTPARDAPSLAPGGRLRVHLPKHAPSRAASKLLEAFIWLDRTPQPGELCVDLGAAPGGWSWVLLEHRAHVLAIDPARLDPIVAKRHGLTHLREDAFRFEPEENVDWLVADMAWRPLEAAALYGKWGRKGWARMLVANIKLPMKKKAEYLLRVRDILESSGWQNLRTRQLYHDRDEVTVGAVRI